MDVCPTGLHCVLNKVGDPSRLERMTWLETLHLETEIAICASISELHTRDVRLPPTSNKHYNRVDLIYVENE